MPDCVLGLSPNPSHPLVHCASKNDSDVAHYNFNAHQPILVIFGADMLQREHAIEWWFFILPFLTNG